MLLPPTDLPLAAAPTSPAFADAAWSGRILERVAQEDREAMTQRLQAHLPFLLERLTRLYGAAPDFAGWLNRLLDRLAELHGQRSEELRRLDAARQADPDWFLGQHMLAYSAYVDRFGGTLQGIKERIPHLQALGVSYLHLLPFLRAREGFNDGGFAVAAYDEIEPALGTMADLEDLTAVLRRSGISLCSDLVLNHVADTHAWALAAKAGDAKYRRYFHCLPKAEADRFEATLGQIFPETAPGNFTHVEAVDAWVWTTFYPYQWDLNYANPDVFADMAAILLDLANRGVEVFRLDSAAFLWKRPGTNCMNQPEAHWILQAFRAIVDIFAPAVLLKAEAIVPTRELPPYLGQGDAAGRECHLAYQSSLMAASWLALATEDASMVRKIVAETPAMPEHASWLTYIRCHDDIGWNVLRGEFSDGDIAPLRIASSFFAGEDGSYARGARFQAVDPQAVHGTNGMASALTGFATAFGEDDWRLARQRLLLLYGLSLSVGGIPMIYMGDEIAQGNDLTPPEQWPAGSDGRQLHRPSLDERNLASICAGLGVSGAFHLALRRLIDTRRQCAALAASVPTRLVELGNPALAAFHRGPGLACVFNFSAAPQQLELDALDSAGGFANCQDLATGHCWHGTLTLPPYGFAWLQPKKTQDTAAPGIRAATSALPQVVVFGEALVDRFVDTLVPGGAPFNVARHLSALGLPVLFLTRLGNDALAPAIRAEMARYGLDEAGLQIDAVHPTGCVDVIESAPGRHSFHIAAESAYDFYESAPLRREKALASLWRDATAATCILYYGTLALRHEQSRSACLDLVDNLPARRFLDFNWRAGHVSQDTAWDAFRKAGMAKVNDEELAMLLAWRGLASPWSARPPEAGAYCAAIASLLAQTLITSMIVTYGGAGYAAFDRYGRCLAQGTAVPGIQVVDTVGAGDAFAAVSLLGTLLGWPIPQTLARANAFAAALCEQRGAVPDTLEFYRPWKEQWQLPTHLSPAAAVAGQP